jgi:hypothetical protein
LDRIEFIQKKIGLLDWIGKGKDVVAAAAVVNWDLHTSSDESVSDRIGSEDWFRDFSFFFRREKIWKEPEIETTNWFSVGIYIPEKMI